MTPSNEEQFDLFPDATLSEKVPSHRWQSLDPEDAPYDPWGASGSGAPLKAKDGTLVTGISGKLKNEVRQH